jgi:hypothetical protein
MSRARPETSNAIEAADVDLSGFSTEEAAVFKDKDR